MSKCHNVEKRPILTGLTNTINDGSIPFGKWTVSIYRFSSLRDHSKLFTTQVIHPLTPKLVHWWQRQLCKLPLLIRSGNHSYTPTHRWKGQQGWYFAQWAGAGARAITVPSYMVCFHPRVLLLWVLFQLCDTALKLKIYSYTCAFLLWHFQLIITNVIIPVFSLQCIFVEEYRQSPVD